MPSFSQHTTQAQKNIDFLKSFYSTYLYNDWAVTVSFYASIHIIEGAIFEVKDLKYGDGNKTIKIEHSSQFESVLIKNKTIVVAQNQKPRIKSDHNSRKILVLENFQDIETHYSMLYNEARNSRYYAYKFSKVDVQTLIPFTLKKIVKWSNKEFLTKFNVSFL